MMDSSGSVPALIYLGCASAMLAAAVALVIPAVRARKEFRHVTAASIAHNTVREGYASWSVDRAVKSMVFACTHQGTVVPGVVMVIATSTRIELHLSSPARAPAPWVDSPDFTTWSCSLAEIQTARIGAATNPYAGLVTLGMSDGALCLVDLTQACGLISIVGDPTAGEDLARHWIRDFSENPWSAALPLLLVDLDELSTPGTTTTTIDGLLDEIDSGSPGLSFVRDHTTATALECILESGGCRWPVVTLGDAPLARWKFTAHKDGWVTSDFLPAALTRCAATAGPPASEQERLP